MKKTPKSKDSTRKKKLRKEKKHKEEKFKDLKTAYKSLENPKKFYRSVLLPLVGLGGFIFFIPFIMGILLPIPLELNPLTFTIGGIVLIVLGIFSPYLMMELHILCIIL